MIREITKYIVLLTTMLLVGCGGGGGSSSSSGSGSSSSTGVFIDDVVSGLKYINGSITGYTNEKGEFEYTAGTEVEFYLGGISLGKIKPNDNQVWIQDLVGVDRTDTDNAMVLEIARLLQSVDDDPITSEIEISRATFNKFENIKTELQTEILNNSSYLDTAVFTSIPDITLISKEIAKNHLDNSIVKYIPEVKNDTIAPTLKYNKSEQEVVSHSTKYIVEGEASDNVALKQVILEINGTSNKIEIINGNYATSLPLKAGKNDYKIVAIDKNENKTEVSGSVYLGHTTAGANSHSGALKDGKLYTWGRNNYAQTGLGYTSTLSGSTEVTPHPISPIKIETSKTFVALSFNQNFSTAIDENGDLWTWGEDKSGQLGQGDEGKDTCVAATPNDCRKVIGKVNGLNDVVVVAAGYNHTVTLKKDGTVWTFGKNGTGQLGNGTIINSSIPVQVIFNESDLKIVSIAASSNSSYAIDDKGRVWGWGSNSYANLGQGATGATQSTPILVPFSNNVEIVSIAAGKDHVLALDKTGIVYGWGLNASSQVGFNGVNYKGKIGAWVDPIVSPTIIPATQNNPAMGVFANGNTSYIIRNDNKVYPWGQFGRMNPDTNKPEYPNLDEPEDMLPLLTSVKDMAVGSLYQVAVQKDGTIFTWGWSFEGSLGGGESVLNSWMYNSPIIPVFGE